MSYGFQTNLSKVWDRLRLKTVQTLRLKQKDHSLFLILQTRVEANYEFIEGCTLDPSANDNMEGHINKICQKYNIPYLDNTRTTRTTDI